MKKSILAATLILLSFASTSFAQVVAEDQELTQGKIEAAAFNHLKPMNDEFDAISKKIVDMQDARSEDESGIVGQLGKLQGEVETFKGQFLEHSAEMQKQSGDELFATYAKALKALSGARAQLTKAKELIKN